MNRLFLIKYSEIGVKGKNRHIFEDMLVKNIRSALKALDGETGVRKAEGRIYISCDEEEADDAVKALKKVFGIAWICPMEQFGKIDMDTLRREAIVHMRKEFAEELSSKETLTFKVNTRRADKAYPFTSVDVNEQVGEALLNEFENLKVDVHTPEVVLNIEIRPHDTNIYSRAFAGLNGMPVGTSGKAMLLLSGGIDSPVAGYLMAKRGVRLSAVYFHAPPYTSERAKQKVVDLAKIISEYSGPIRLHIINFTDIQMKIYEICPHDELTIIMRRFMMKIAQDLAAKEECLGLVTGESIGQVASQTMQSLAVTNEVCHMPVYRPLCCYDKQEIINISEQINAYETSILPYEDCCTIFVAKHPVTKPKTDRIKRSERKLDGMIGELYENAIKTAQVIEIG